jgi:protein-S-isoprenylcysteine O-methyltransferase Ste14
MNVLQPWNLVFLVGLVAYFKIRHGFIRRLNLMRQPRTIRKVDALEKILLLGMSISVLALPVLYLFTPLLSFADYELPLAVQWLGLGVMAVSLWLFRRSHADLGKNWSVSLELREGHELVQDGVYRHVRHPMYASIWLWAIAQGMMLENWLAGWSVVPAFAAMYFLRTPREERLMCEAFGEPYRQYMRQTGRLWPRIRRASSSAD